MAKINNNSSVKEAIQEYVNRGFGSMTKNDFEVWIFSQLLCGSLKGKNNREISIKLRIPDTKVKRLRYESDLKWGSPDKDETYHDALVEVIKKARLARNKTQILLVIEDTALLKYLDAKMKSANVAWDKSFNSENIYIDFEQYDVFCKEVLNKEYNEAIECLDAKYKHDQNGHPLANFFRDFLQQVRKDLIDELSISTIEIAKKGAKVIVNNGLPLLVSMIL